MPKVIYRPKPGGTFVAPNLKPGTQLEVSAREAEHLVDTGAFERFTPDPQPEPAPEVESKPAKNGRKEAK